MPRKGNCKKQNKVILVNFWPQSVFFKVCKKLNYFIEPTPRRAYFNKFLQENDPSGVPSKRTGPMSHGVHLGTFNIADQEDSTIADLDVTNAIWVIHRASEA